MTNPDALAGVVARVEQYVRLLAIGRGDLSPSQTETDIRTLLAALAEAQSRIDELTGPEMARKIRTAVLTLPTIYDRADGPFVSRTDAICAVLDVTHQIPRTPQPETPE